LTRDLKPENVLLASNAAGAQLKVIDFGTSDFCKPGQRLTQKFGTPYYVAPEVSSQQQPWAPYSSASASAGRGCILCIRACGWDGRPVPSCGQLVRFCFGLMPCCVCHMMDAQVLQSGYNAAIDVWSAGVIMYILLCGYPPFGGKSDARILQRVQQGSYSFANKEVGVRVSACITA